MHTLATLHRQLPAALDLPTNVELPSGFLRLYRLLGNNEMRRTYHAVHQRKEVVFKCTCVKNTASENAGDTDTRLAEMNYHRLKELGIPLAELIDVDHERGFLIKEFIPGMTAAEMIADGLPSRDLLVQLFAIATVCRNAGVSIDFFPANFVIRSGRLHYISYTVLPYTTYQSLEDKGLYFWANTAGMRTFLQKGSQRLLMEREDGREPLRAPFASIVRNWIRDFAQG